MTTKVSYIKIKSLKESNFLVAFNFLCFQQISRDLVYLKPKFLFPANKVLSSGINFYCVGAITKL